MWRNLLVVGLVAAVGVAALVDSLRGGSDSVAAAGTTGEKSERGVGDSLSGPDVPAPGALPGVLVLIEPDGCRIREIEFADGSLGHAGPETTCRVWVAPVGDRAVVPTGRGELAGTREIALVRLGEEPEIEESLGAARGEVEWSRDGRRVAWCAPDGNTTLRDVETGDEREVAGCYPRIAPDGSIYTRPGGTLVFELWRNGEVLLGPDDLAKGLEERGPLDIVGFDVGPDGLLAVTVAAFTPSRTEVALELWRGQTLEISIPLPERVGPGNALFGSYVAFSPTGNELALGYSSGPGDVTLVDLELRRIVLPAVDQEALAWSPDGSWLALAVGDEVRIFGALRDVAAYTLPLSAVSLGWGGEEPPP